MSGAFAAAAAVLFADPNLSVVATLTIKDHLPRPVRVIRRDLDVEGEVASSFTRSLSTTFEILKVSCPQPPPKGTALTIGHESWSVFDVSSNVRKGTWILSAEAG